MVISGATMKNEEKTELAGFLKTLPPVQFCCVYGSTLHPNNSDKSSMVDYILGVADPLKWHSENLKLNRSHYASWMVHLGGAKLVTKVADGIGVGVHFNPFVTWNDKMLKYGVVRMHDLVEDILNWQRFYISGRLQKPVRVLLDNLDVENLNATNLRTAIAAALLILPSKFNEEDLYSTICSLSYMGDLRMIFAEDKNKVKKIVQGQFNLFRSMYKPFIEEYEAKDVLRVSSFGGQQANLSQVHLQCPTDLISGVGTKFQSASGLYSNPPHRPFCVGQVVREVVFSSREEAARSMQKVVRRTVIVSSLRQAVSGFVAAGGMNAGRYLANKVRKAWKSWT
ncbi:unnamed protein product [Linum tenue]|uniref:Phosphatidate cytidylyltransferase, mitochondrial n=1 Tax=Linum tenue TaxID=586396 RepID=A0AAV0IAD5_9ROSI|nr:unnamed protein product [Linum tenue]